MDDSAATGGPLKRRQKNCNSCVQAKRRCDRRSPLCSRCAKKNTACEYGKLGNRSDVNGGAEGLSPGSTRRLSFGSLPCSLFVPDLSPNLDHLGFMPERSQADRTASGLGSVQDFMMDMDPSVDISLNRLDDYTGNTALAMQDQWLVQNPQAPYIDCSSTKADEEIMRAYKKMTPLCVGLSRIPIPAIHISCRSRRSPCRTLWSHGISTMQSHHSATS